MTRMMRSASGQLRRVHPVRRYRILQPYVVQYVTPPASDIPQPPTGDESKTSRDRSSTAPQETQHPPETQPIRNGNSYRVTSPPEHSLVTPQLAQAVSRVLEQFAQANGFGAEKLLDVAFGRGTLGLHRFKRAVDIYAVGGKGLGQWAHEWNVAMRQATTAPDPQKQTQVVTAEKARNLGYKLYKALQAQGGWAQPSGYPVQLFGPWTRSEGPHKAISDQLLHAHRDHIHVAR